MFRDEDNSLVSKLVIVGNSVEGNEVVSMLRVLVVVMCIRIVDFLLLVLIII